MFYSLSRLTGNIYNKTGNIRPEILIIILISMAINLCPSQKGYQFTSSSISKYPHASQLIPLLFPFFHIINIIIIIIADL